MAVTKIRIGVLAALGAASFSAAQSRAAVTLFDSGGFEPGAGYQAGTTASPKSLIGQPGGASSANQFTGGATGAGVSANVDTYVNDFVGSSPVVSNLQLVTLNDTATTASGSFYPANTFTPGGGAAITPSGLTSTVDILFQMSVTASAGNPLFGAVAYDSTGNQLAELLVDGATGLIEDGYNNSKAVTPGAANFLDYELQLNYATQTYSVYVAPVGTTAFTAANLVYSGDAFISPSTTFGVGALTTTPGSAGPVTGVGYFDNYSVVAVPEPTVATLAVGGIAMLAGGRRRRKVAAGR